MRFFERTDIRRSLIASVLVFSAFCAFAAHPPRTFPKREGGPIVTFTDNAVLAEGATPGATVYFAGVTLAPGDYVIRVQKAAGSAVADAGGRARFGAAIDTRSVWIAVDGANGGYTVAAPHGMLLREIDFPGRSAAAGDGQIRKLLLERYAIDVVLIRPGQGLWGAYLRDGGPADEDGAVNGKTEARLASLTPVAKGLAPADRLEPGDVLFLVDRNTLEFHVMKRGN